MAVIGYIRVSTLDQSTARQLEGIKLDHVFEDKASGKDTKREQLQALLSPYATRPGDIVMVHSMDRLARSVVDLRTIVDTLVNKGVEVHFVKEKLTFRKPADGVKTQEDLMADMMLSIMGAVAEFERGIIRERQREGIQLAKAKTGVNKVYLGRKPSLSPVQIMEIRQKVKEGAKKSDLAAAYNVSRQTIYMSLASAENAEIEAVFA